MNPIKYNILFFISVIYIAIMLYLNNVSMAYGYIGILFFVRILNGREKLYKTNLGIYLLSLVLLAFLAMVVTGYLDYFHVLALLILTFSIAFIIVQRIIENKDKVYLIANALIISGLLATVISYLLSGGEFARLRLGDNVRQLSNTVGMSLIFIAVFYFTDKKKISSSFIINSQFQIMYRLKIPITLLLIVGLFATMSRGVMFALGVSIVFLVVNNLYKNIKKIKLQPIIKIALILLFIGGFAFKYGLTFLSNFNIRTELLTERLGGEAVEGGTGIREKIWHAGYSGLEGGQLIYGHGISSFQMLAARNGYDYYAHSVFMDTLVSTGFLGLGILVLLLLRIGRNIILNKNHRIFALFIFLIMGYFTHGAITSSGFWILLAIIFGLSNYKENTKEKALI